MTAVSIVVLIALAMEWILLDRFGALGARQRWGDAFVLLHLFTFFLSVPSLINVIVLPPKRRPIVLWVGAGLLGGILFFLVVNVQYSVSEAWEGPDGIGGPYSTQPNSTVAPATTRGF